PELLCAVGRPCPSRPGAPVVAGEPRPGATRPEPARPGGARPPLPQRAQGDRQQRDVPLAGDLPLLLFPPSASARRHGGRCRGGRVNRGLRALLVAALLASAAA